MPQVSFGTFSKKRNSTKQPGSLGDTRNVKLKDLTSVDAPTFILRGNEFNYNYAKWDDRYYFISDIRSMHDGLTEIDCVMDPLATYKSYILSSTQYVSYSSVSGGLWLADTRIPLETKGVGHRVDIVNPAFSKTGTYILSVVGQSGCELYKLTRTQISDLLDKVNDWSDDLADFSFNGKNIDGSQQATTYQWDTTDLGVNFESLGKMITLSGLFGNAYNSAPSCIRSCIWVPFAPSVFTTTSTQLIYLGQFNTGVVADAIASTPYTDSYSVTIPWTYNDWRRATCEDLYMYLPLVGIVHLESSNITVNTSVNIKISVTPTDGAVAYELTSGEQIIGTYGGSCAANFPIGISQQASAGDILTAALQGAEKTVSMGIQSSLSPISGAASAVGIGLESFMTAYNITNVQYSRNNSCIGGIGGGVGAGLDLFARLYVVDHAPILDPLDMMQTMGVPTMKPIPLSSCTGFCQCVNAHVDAPAMAHELNAIDAMLNSGFYIE